MSIFVLNDDKCSLLAIYSSVMCHITDVPYTLLLPATLPPEFCD